MDFIKTLTRKFKKKGKTILLNFIIVLCSIAFYLLDQTSGNKLTDFIAENSAIQALLFFLTIKGFLSFIFPSSLQRETKESLLLSLQRENYKKLQRDKEKEELRKIASIG